MAKRKSTKAAELGLAAVRNTFQELGEGLIAQERPKLVPSLRAGAAAFTALGEELAGIDERLDAAGYRRLGERFGQAAEIVSAGRGGGEAGVAIDASDLSPVLEGIARRFFSIAASADRADFDGADKLRQALEPLYDGAAEFRFIDSLIGGRGLHRVKRLRAPIGEALSGFGSILVQVATTLPIGILPSIEVCPDECTCGTLLIGPVFTGRFNVYPVQGGLRKVAPIYAAVFCCNFSCLVIFSQCLRTILEKDGSAPDAVSIVSRRRVGRAKRQIRARRRTLGLTVPTFGPGDC